MKTSELTISQYMPDQNCLTIALGAFYFDRSIEILYDEDHVIFKRDNEYFDATGQLPQDKYVRMLPLETLEQDRIARSFQLEEDNPTMYLLRLYYDSKRD